ncbi:hypothetical protein DL93DRAFT_2056342 [Clavulina sp. PMI_390]|nr:hypothetical protein DL93DRAFT_2056342 [Clavulina sp. PMI_390]
MLWKKYATRLERRRSSASQRTSQPDWLLVTAAGQAYAASGRFSDAWDLFHRTSLRDDQDTVELQHGRLMFLTTFIRALSFANRPNVAYALWDSMESCYGVRPDNHTLNVILMTASTHSKPSAAVSLSQQMGWRLRRGSSTISEGAGLDREELFKHIHAELLDQAAPPRRDIGFWWRERPAWQVAREIFREVVLGNWPELVRLEPPVTANPEGYHPLIDWRKLRSSITAQPSSGTVQGISASESHQDVTSDGNVVDPPRILTIPPVSVGKYYDIVPNQRSFDAYIQLLCAHDLIAELPEVLLWARELGILPSHRSLRLGLAYFADIGAAAPFDQAVLGAAGDSPYERLRTWLKEWVPAGYIPTEREIREERALWGTEKDSSMRVEVAKRKRLMNAKYRAARGDLRRKKKGSRWKQALKERLMQGGDTTQRNVTIW